MTLGDALKRGADFLARKGIDTARLDTELLLAHALGMSRIELYMHYDRPLNDDEVERSRRLLDRRGRREPVAYILGEWGFRNLMLAVDRRVLIPRPGTEVVVERCLELLRDAPEPRVLDVGTGSGAIALAIADEHRGARVHAIDVSADALDVARANAERTGLAGRVTFEQRDLNAGFAGEYELVVANPPYVGAEELPGLEPDVRDWEPRGALVGAGLHEQIAAEARSVLCEGGALVLEVGDTQAVDVAARLDRLGYEHIASHPDLTGRDRAVEGRWTTSTAR